MIWPQKGCLIVNVGEPKNDLNNNKIRKGFLSSTALAVLENMLCSSKKLNEGRRKTEHQILIEEDEAISEVKLA